MFELLSMICDVVLCDGPKRNSASVGQNEANMMRENNKKIADSKAMAEIQIENEKDPIRKRKMINRLSMGITDFSDI